MDTGGKIDWHSEESHLFLNPRLPESEKSELEELAKRFAKPAHIWIASSGSSKQAGQSLKLMALSKSAFLASARAVNQHLQSDSKDVWIQNLPRFHVGGLSIEARAFLSGAQVVRQESWDAEAFCRLVESVGATLSALVPTQVFDLLQLKRRAPASLKAIVIGGSALSEELYQSARELGWPLLPSYGMTECCSQIATAALDSWRRSERALQILSHVEARTGESHILEVRSPALMTGFAQIINGEMIWSDPKVDGWYRTQDMVEIQGSFLIPKGRGSDFVKVNGEGVDLQRLQSRLEILAQQMMPQQWQSFSLTAVPDSRTGHRILMQYLGDVDAAELQAEFNRQVAPFERISELKSVSELPWKKRSPQSW